MHVQKGSALTSNTCKEPIPQSHQNGHALRSDHVRLHLTVVSERPLVLDRVFLVTDQEPPLQEWQLPLHLSYSTEFLALISYMEGTNPLTMTEWLSPYI